MREPKGSGQERETAKMIDLSFWKSPSDLRRELHAEGFGIVELQAQLASAICGSVFSASDYLAESDAKALFFTDNTLCPSARDFSKYPNTYHAMLARRLREMSDWEASDLYFGKLEQQKILETANILPAFTLDDLSKGTIKRFIEKTAGYYGFEKRQNNSPPPSHCFCKEVSAAEIEGRFTWDSGGRFDSFRPGQAPFIPNLRFRITRQAEREPTIAVSLWEIVSGMSAYIVTKGAIPKNDIQTLSSIPVDHWIQITEIGIVAQIRFFDLFLKSLNNTLKEGAINSSMS